MRKILNYLKKIALWILIIYASLFIFVGLATVTSNIGVKKPINGVVYSDHHKEVFKTEGFESPWKEINPTENWNSPPDWAVKNK